MPRSVLIMSDDSNLFEKVRAILGSDSRFIVTEDGLHCDGSTAPLTNIYPVENPAYEWEGWNPGDNGLLKPESMSSLIFETRSPTWVAEVGRLLSQDLAAHAWFVDSAEVAWPASEVDPDQVALA